MRDFLAEMTRCEEAKIPFAIATIVRVSGSAPQQPGARILVREDGSLFGTVGGGAIEMAIIDDLKQVLTRNAPTLKNYDLGRDLGMCCGGRMEVFLEAVTPPQKLTIFGAGHVAQPTAKLALTVGFNVTVIDDRLELLTEDRFPGCTLIQGDPSDAKDLITPTERDWMLIVTHDHRLDEETLDTFARLPHRYIGCLLYTSPSPRDATLSRMPSSA